MKRLEIRFLSCLLFAPLAAQAQKPDLNSITRVEVKGSTVEIAGNRKPNFSTFTMTDPPRLVVDISEAVFSGVPEDIQVSGGVVTSIRTASYGADVSSIARVLIGFTREVETDVKSSGTKLVVKVLRTSTPEVAAIERVNPPEQTATRDEQLARKSEQDRLEEEKRQGEELNRKAIAEKALKAEQERLEAQRQTEVAARAEEERLANEKRRLDEADRRAAVEQALKVEEQRLAEQQAKAPTPANDDRPAENREADRQVQEDRVACQAEERLAKQQAREEAVEARRQAAAEKARKAEEERLEKKRAREEAREAARQAVAEKARKAEEERLGKQRAREEAKETARQAAAEKARKQEEQLTQQQARDEGLESERQAAAERARVAEQEQFAQEKPREAEQPAADETKANRGPRIVSGHPEPNRAEVERGESSPKVSSKRKTMTFIGFERRPSASRVYVRTNEPVRYSVQQSGDKLVILELENTRIGLRNNRRPLDTSFFDTAVAMVAPNLGASRRVRVQIKLKEPVAYQAKQEGNVVSVEFSNPAKR